MTVSVIQAAWTVEFEDSLRIGNQSEAGNNLQRVCTKPEIYALINSSCIYYGTAVIVV